MASAIKEQLISMWCDPLLRPPFKGALIDSNGCCCAQGQALRLSGMSDDELRWLSQDEADKTTAELLDISLPHAVLLRNVNDRRPGSPQDVLVAPEKILGKHASLILEFWWFLDSMSADARNAAGAVNAPGDAHDGAWTIAGIAAGPDARNAAGAVSCIASWITTWNAARAGHEIQGHEILAAPLLFLPLFGISIDELKERASQRS